MRVKRRYLLCRIEKQEARKDKKIAESNLFKAIREQEENNFGIYLYSTETGVSFIEKYDDESGYFVLRCAAKNVFQVKLCLSYCTKIADERIVIHLLDTKSTEERVYKVYEDLLSKYHSNKLLVNTKL